MNTKWAFRLIVVGILTISNYSYAENISTEDIEEIITEDNNEAIFPEMEFGQEAEDDTDVNQSNTIDITLFINGNAATIYLPGDVPLQLLWIPPGNFIMGSPIDELNRSNSESPQHSVTFQKGFWMSKYELTQIQWYAIMGNDPSYFKGDNRPVEMVSWNDIRGPGGFIDKLNALYPRYGFRLPNEAEWEYAYRAGTATRFWWGDDPNHIEIDNYAWYWSNSNIGNGRETHDVGLKLPNAWGLHDMAGNVWEWCEDDWHSNYDKAPIDNSAWVDNPRGKLRLLRGGSWHLNQNYCRAASRYNYNPDVRYYSFGFRVVCTLD